MNKQIKFRAWDNKSQQMLFQNQQYGLEPQYKIQDDCWTRFWEALYRCQEQVILLQFTGLLDKNGKEIYCGDIIEQDVYGNKIRGIIDFYDNGFWIKNPDNTLYLPNDRRIIGNQFENPELL